MKYALGDRVRIIECNKTGSICDAYEANGKSIYIVDCSGECDSEDFLECVNTVDEVEIEPLYEQ